MLALACPTRTRLFSDGKVIADDFGPDQVPVMLHDHPEAVLWLDLFDPEMDDMTALGEEFGLHPVALEDAVQDHERPKLDKYQGHLFVNVYAVDLATEPDHTHYAKTEISAFVTDRALITVRKSPSDTDRLVERWDADADLCADGGVAFLLYGLLDLVVDGHYAASERIDEAMDGVEDALLSEGGAPRAVRMHGVELRKLAALLRRAVTPMPDLVGKALRSDLGLVGEHLRPYYRDVEDHAQRSVAQVEHQLDRIDGLLQADLAEQGNVLNIVARKLAAWAAIIAVPTAITGFFGQNLPFPGFEKFSGFLFSLGLITVSAGGLFLYLKRRGWL